MNSVWLGEYAKYRHYEQDTKNVRVDLFLTSIKKCWCHENVVNVVAWN